MGRRKIEPIKTRIMTIVHGKSEYKICQSIKSNLKLKHEIVARDKGEHSIQITSILDILNDSRFKTFDSFIRAYDDVEYKKGKLINFKLFIILDVDDCTQQQKKMFINKALFKKHWLYEYIVPIYNDPNLEKTMNQAGIPIEKKKDYFIVFPTNHGDLDVDKAIDFADKLEKCKCSNMNEYVEHCLKLVNGMAKE